MIFPHNCFLCGEENENIQHIFFYCSKSKKLIHYSDFSASETTHK